MADAEREKLIDKIHKLRRKAEGTNNPTEADSFMAKVVKLMEQHAIDDAELNAISVTKVGLTAFRWKMRYYCGWQRDMYLEIAGSFGCCYSFVAKKQEITTYGKEEWALASVECHNDVTEQILRYSRVLFPGDRGKQRRAEAGLGYGVADRIRKIRDASRSNGKALVTNHQREAEEFMEKLHPKMRKAVDRTISVSTEFAVGYNNAGVIQVQGQVK